MAASLPVALRRKLLKIGGHDVEVVVPDDYLWAIVDHGELFGSAQVRIVRGSANQCHRNAALLWLRGRSEIIATGYYLAFDGVWRQHSWGIAESTIILDTHSGGRHYFGIRLEGIGALLFAKTHCRRDTVAHWINKQPERFASIYD